MPLQPTAAFVSATALPILTSFSTSCTIRRPTAPPLLTTGRALFLHGSPLRPSLPHDTQLPRQRPATKSPQMRMGGGNSSPPAPPAERVLATLPYLIPLLDSLSFGKFVFAKVPLLGQLLLGPLFPIYSIYRGVPFFAFGVFIALFILVVRNNNISRYIRFNTYQALVLDIALIFPQLFQGVNTRGFIPGSVVEVCTTAVFYAISLAITYAVVTNAKGQVPDEIPGVSASVYQQLGPF